MSDTSQSLYQWIDQLEQVLIQLDSINADIAAIHVDIAILELCELANVDRDNRTIRAA